MQENQENIVQSPPQEQTPSRTPVFRPGDPAPWFSVPSLSNPRYAFNSVAGRYVVLGFFQNFDHPLCQTAWQEMMKNRAIFNDEKIALFGIVCDPENEKSGRIKEDIPGIRFFLDYDFNVSKLYGALVPSPQGHSYRPHWIVLDPFLRVLATAPLQETERLRKFLEALPDPDRHAGTNLSAPVLIIPRIFEPAFCKTLIEQYENGNPAESGFMRERDGKTIQVTDYSFKRRQDIHVDNDSIREAAKQRIVQRLVPEIRKAFQFKVTRIERCIVACYEAETEGHFRPHRDDTTMGTAHRRFAVSINLNAEEFEGGELRFPEFGSRLYRPPTGGAVVFSCSLLHEATTVTKGRRYAFLPFLYDEEAAKLREKNNAYLGEGIAPYRL